MAEKVKFQAGLREAFTSLQKNEYTFYYVTDDKKLYLGEKELTNPDDLAEKLAQVVTNKNDITTLKDELSKLVGGEEGESIADMIDKAIKAYVGEKTELTTTATGTIVEAINELDLAIDTNKTALTVTVEKTEDPSGVAAQYTIKQGGAPVGITIDIPKDMVVSNGEVKTISSEEAESAGHDAGTYIVLTIANAESSELWIPVGKLVDIYTAATDPEKIAEIKVTVDNTNNEISAELVEGGVAKTKLAADVQTSLGKADTALQPGNITIGEANGTFKVKDQVIAIAGLQDLAYTTKEALITELDEKYDETGAAETAETNAKAYTDTALTWGDFSAE